MRLNNRYIGCNFTGNAFIGGVDSSYSGIFNKEEVLIESGIGDYIPCMIGDISDAYELLKNKLTENNATNFSDICTCIYDTVNTYFGGFNNIKTRMSYYKDLDEIESEEDIGKVSSLKGKGAAMCVERAMLSQNLLQSLGFKSFYKTSAIKNNNKPEIHAYNLLEHNNEYYIFDTSLPNYIDGKINPLIASIPKKVYESISSPKQREGCSVSVSHYNPIRNKDIEIIYDAGRNDIYYVENDNIKKK